MDKINKIIFVAEMRNPKTAASSTQIMTRNLLIGFGEIAEKVIFVPVIRNKSDELEIRQFYQPNCNKIYFSYEKTKYKDKVILRQFSWLYRSMVYPKNIIPEDLLDEIDKDTLLVSQSPPIDAALLCASIKKAKRDVRYIQYWGDPLALSLITPEQYNWKRCILRRVEMNLHRISERVVYGTKSLYDAEIKIMPRIIGIADYSKVSYIPDTMSSTTKSNKVVFGYFGNYYSSIRDIVPLVKAFKYVKDARLVVCGSSDLCITDTDNVSIKGRIPQIEVENEESSIDVEVCMLNKTGVQIPGKIFYHTNTKRHILVILDGPRKDAIRKELEESHRFIFCNNTEYDIKTAIEDIIRGKYSADQYDINFYSPRKVCKEILFGHNL